MLLKLLITFHLVVVGIVSSENGGIFREYKEDLNEFLTSEEVDRLVYGNDESVISEKIRNLPDVGMSPPGSLKHHLPVPTLDPPLESVPGAPLVKKLHPQRQNFMTLMKKAAASMLGHNRNSKQRRPSRHERPIPQYRQRPSTLVSSDPDQLEIAFKRIEIMASRAGLNMSSIPRRTQMQVIKKLIPKLPPRMAQMMKTTMEHSSYKLYDYLPEPARDPLVEDDPDFIQHFMEDSKVTMDASDFGLVGDHGYEYTESTHEILPTSHSHPDEITHVITDHQPGTDYSVPAYDASGPSPSTQSFELSVPPSFEISKHSTGFGTGGRSYESHQSHSPVFVETHSLDLKPIAAPLISESHDIQYEASENVPSIISPHAPSYRSPTRSNKAIKVSNVKNVTPSVPAPVIRVSMPTKDEIKMPRPIRVSIITKDNNTNINPFVMNVDPIYDADVKEIKHSEEESKDVSGGGGEAVGGAEKEVRSTTTTPTGILISSTTTTAATTTSAPTTTTVPTTSRSPISKKDNPLLGAASSTSVSVSTSSSSSSSSHTPEDQPLKFADNLSLLDEDKYLEDDLLFKDDLDYDADQDLTSSELIAELKKYNSDYANSLELDYPLAPHPLEYPDHPDHPDNSDTIVSTASSLTSPRPTMQQILDGHKGFERHRYPPHHRPGHGGPRPGHMRPRVRPPPPGHPRHRPHLPRRPPIRPKQQQPLRINDVKVSQIPQSISKECDYFSDDLCLAVQDYPIEAISEAMNGQPETAKLFVKEPGESSSWVDGVGKVQEGAYNYKHYYGDKANQEAGNHRHRDFAGEGGFLCPSKVAYGRVKKGKSSSSGEWKYIVNYGEVSQTLRLEKCLFPGNSCSYVMPYYRTACTQVYNYHRLLAWDSEKGLHMDMFKIPTCCTCHVQGYYVPGQQHGVTPARRRDMPPKLQYSPQRSRLRQPHPPLHQRNHPHQPHPFHHSMQQQQGGQVYGRRESGMMAQQQQVHQQQVSSPSTPKSQQSRFNDELHDLLAQYSSLRERITKKKNERQSLLSAIDGNPKENSKRESSVPQKKSQIARFQRAMMYNMLKRMKKNNSTTVQKKLIHLLKEANATAKPMVNKRPDKATHFNGTAHKLKSTRAFNLQKIASVLGNLSSGRSARHGLVSVEKTGGTPEGNARRSRAMLMKHLSENPKAMRRYLRQMRRRRGRGMLRDGAELDEIRFFRRALLKSRRDGVAEAKMDVKAAAASGTGAGGKKNGEEKRPGLKVSGKRRLELLKRLQQRKAAERENRVRQRLRFGPNKSHKVNYSYHPIMAYFAGKHS